MVDFVMPILGADMVAGTLVEWRRRPGERVARGDVLAQVETEKGIIDVEVFVDGVLERIVVQPGTTVPTGTVLAMIREDVPAGVTAAPPAAAAPPPAAVAPPPPAPPPAREARGVRARVTPLAKKLAAELGVDVTALAGTGPGGAVTREDVERAAAAARPAAPARAGYDVAAMRRTIGAAMARSKREIPHYYLAHTIDLQHAADWLAEENTRRPVTERLLPGVLFVKAVARALREVPELNAVWRDGRAEPSAAVHVGVAITLRGGGLVAPALHDADRRTLGELMAAFRDLVQRARSGGLRSSELSDPTITVTSLGDQGVETVFGIVYPPQTAIVGFGRVVRRPWVVDGGAIGPRTVVTATLSADHRVTDGHRGGLFLAALERLLQAPERL
jgi:pyruvate dehydrogenase E2 component (dihydrolipoamide acetyltransferase)